MKINYNKFYYNPLPDNLSIRKSDIHGYGIFASVEIKKDEDLGSTHIKVPMILGFIRTPLGGFYNHSDDPTVVRMVTDTLPKLKFGDELDIDATTKKFPGKDNDGENVFFNLQEKPDAKYFFMVAAKDIKAGQELTANYNLYTYPKTGIGLQML